uniref:Uncharacterized protein n=1 Tax=Anguilla anguilla TaxID=7936 RepID=A0A0E9U5S5_ANGAN
MDVTPIKKVAFSRTTPPETIMARVGLL